MATHPDCIDAARIRSHSRFLELGDPEHADYSEAYVTLCGQIARGESTVVAAPSLLGKAASFASHVTSVMSGGRQLSDQEYEARLAICRGCEMYDEGTCKACGCKLMSSIPLLAKARWESSVCPRGYWPATTDSRIEPKE